MSAKRIAWPGSLPLLGPRWRLWIGLLLLLIGGSQSTADEVRLLTSDRASLQARRQMINSSVDQLNLAFFSFKNDSVSRELMAGLIDASARGVQVRLVVDAFYAKIPLEYWEQLVQCGGEVRVFHAPQLPQVQTLTRRLHDKYMARDNVEMIVGSRNIEQPHFGFAARPSENYTDINVLIRGASVACSVAYFETLWASPQLSPIGPRQLASRLTSRKCAGWESDREHSERLAGNDNHLGPLSFEVPAENIEFLSDVAAEKGRPGGLPARVFELLNNAQHSILIESPYIITEGELSRILEAAICRGVAVSIVTNSPASTDRKIVYSAYSHKINRLVRLGAEVFEYQGPRILHAKTFVIDHQLAGITSFNFDPRSRCLDTQTGVVIDDAAVARQLEASIADHQSNSTRRTNAGRGKRLPIRFLLAIPIFRQL